MLEDLDDHKTDENSAETEPKEPDNQLQSSTIIGLETSAELHALLPPLAHHGLLPWLDSDSGH